MARLARARIGPAGTADAAKGRRLLDRYGRLLALTVLGVVVVTWLAVAYLGSWSGTPDTDAYWLAALRLRGGVELYPAWANQNAVEVYRYAPWFAAFWVPLTYLPQEAVYAAWNALCLLGALAAIVPLLRRPSPASTALARADGGLPHPKRRAGHTHRRCPHLDAPAPIGTAVARHRRVAENLPAGVRPRLRRRATLASRGGEPHDGSGAVAAGPCGSASSTTQALGTAGFPYSAYRRCSGR